MRKIGLFTFGLTTLLLVPAALHHLTAGPKQVAKLVAPELHTMQIGDATIDVTSDRAVVEAGGKVRVKLVASAPTTHKVAVEVVVFESIGANGGRTEAPPNRVGRETITLEAKPGGGPSKELAFTLRGEVGSSIGGNDRYGRYTILAMEPKAADELVRLHRRAERSWKPEQRDEKFFAAYDALRWTEDGADKDTTAREPGATARLEIMTHAKDRDVDIKAPDTASLGETFDVAVVVHNRSKKAVSGMHVELSVDRLYEIPNFQGLSEYDVTVTDDSGDDKAKRQTVDIPAKSTKTVVFHLTADKAGVIPLYAHAWAESPDSPGLGYDTSGSGALDAVEIVAPAEGSAPVVGTAD